MKGEEGITSAIEGVRPELCEVGELICDELGDCNRAVKELLGEFDLSAGKMLRPAMVLYSGKLDGQIGYEHIKVAAIIEMIHCATLLHDDVIDGGQVRRGGATVNSVYGNESAVLLGDFVLIKVFQMCRSLPGEIVNIISEVCSGICQGEIRQVMARGNLGLSEDDYLEIVSDKTGRLFGISCELGGMLSGAGSQECGWLYDFGLNSGIAFQIGDDVADIVGRDEMAGKTLARDFARKNVTLPMIHLLGQCDDEEKKIIEERFKSAGGRDDFLIGMLESKGSIAYAEKIARDFGEKGIRALAEMKDCQAKRALEGIARGISGL